MTDVTEQIILLLTNTLLPLAVGYFLHKKNLVSKEMTQKLFTFNVRVVFTILGFISFWRLKYEVSFVWIPVVTLMISFLPFFVMTAITRKQTNILEKGALVTSGMLGNTSTLGGLTAYLLLGPMAYALVQAVAVIQQIVLILFNFPIAQRYHDQANAAVNANAKRASFVELFFTWNQVALIGMVIGAGLSLSGVSQPEWCNDIFKPLILMSSWFGFVPVGLTLDFHAVKDYFRKTLCIFPVKFVLMPVVTWLVCNLLSMSHIETVTLTLISMCPTAINAVITSALYGLKTEVAVSSFVTTTLFFLIVCCPILFFIL